MLRSEHLFAPVPRSVPCAAKYHGRRRTSSPTASARSSTSSSAETTERGYPPSVREIGEAVGLTSPSTVHSHLATLQRLGYLRRDPTKPRAIEVRFDPTSGAAIERRPVRHVPARRRRRRRHRCAGPGERRGDLPLPADFTGDGDLFMLRVRGDSMIDAGIVDGDYVVCPGPGRPPSKGDIVVAGIPGDEATVKTYAARARQIVLLPSNDRLEPMVFDPDEVTIYGKVVTVMRRL